MKRRIPSLVPPPKISYFWRTINGQDKRIKLVRSSLICKILSKENYIVFGHTIYARNGIVNKKTFEEALEVIRSKDK